MKYKNMALPAVLIFCTTLVCACGNDKSVTFKSAGMTHTFNEGDQGTPQEMKAYIYPGAQVAGSTAAHDQEGENSTFLCLSSQDNLEHVADWYKNTLTQNGWKIDSQDSMMGQRTVSISGHQKDVEINVLMAEDGEKTTISVSQGKSVEDTPDEEEVEKFTPNEVTPPTE